MPGQAVAQTLKYAEVVDVDMDATNDVNFADVEDYGHRVVVEMPKGELNAYLGWSRASGAARPAAKLTAANEASFKAAIAASLSSTYVDIDGVIGGLHFGTDNMNLNSDARLRAAGVSANDIPLSFVLYKLYGASAATTLDTIYNLEDAHGMLSSETVAEAIVASFKGAESGAVDTMFRDLLAADPHRFFDASGIPMAGIFETNADSLGAGGWNITADDTLEVRTKLIFHSKVTRRGIAGREHLLSSSDAAASQENQQTVIAPEDYFYVRLQIKAVDGGAAAPVTTINNLFGMRFSPQYPGLISFNSSVEYAPGQVSAYKLVGANYVQMTTFGPVHIGSTTVGGITAAIGDKVIIALATAGGGIAKADATQYLLSAEYVFNA